MRRLAAAVAVVLLAGCGGETEEDPVVSGAQIVRASGVERAKPSVSRDEVRERAAADAAFGFALQRRLGSRDENLVVSPYSVTHAFALAYAGARGRTREELAAALRFPEEGDELHPALNALDRAVESREGENLTIDTANSAWGQRRFPWKPEFLEILARHHGAGMRTVDFEQDREGAAAALDEWVREQTRGKIEDLFSADDFDELTRLVLANAAYLKAKWHAPFSRRATSDKPFHAPAGRVEVPTMTGRRKLPFAEGDGWEAAELPYEGEQLAMLVVLPEAGGLEDVERRLGDGLLGEIAGALAPADLEVALPKVRIESTHELAPPLRELGVVEAFDEEQADFSGMSGEQLYLAKARQKAFVRVDEEGTEAAAATGVVVTTTSLRPPARPFVVDRPFLFVIRDGPTGAVLFSGRVTDPSRG